MKIFEEISKLGSLIKYMPTYYTQRLTDITEILESENELAKFSSMNFVTVLRPVLKKLSSMEAESFSEVYKSYLDEAKMMVLEGNELADVLSYYDMKLVRKGKVYVRA